MTSVFSEEESKVARIKQKLMNDVHVKEETRSFLSFSRENLSISQSDLEQGYNKQRFRPNRNTILSVTALLIAFLCLALECWEFRYSLINAREIEDLKRSVDSLKHRILEEDLLDEVKAFEEQLYTEEFTDDDDDDNDEDDDDDDENAEEVNIDKADYNSNYDEDTFSLQDYTPIFGARPSDFPDSSSTIAPVPSPPDPPVADKALMKSIPTARKIGVKQSEESKKNHDNSNRDPSRDKNNLEGEMEDNKNETKRKRDVLNTKDFSLDWKITLKRKRSIDQKNYSSKRLLVNRHLFKNHIKRTIASDSTSREVSKEKSAQDEQNMSVGISSRHPPKKYYIHSSLNTTEASSSMPHDESNTQVATNRIKKIPRKFRKNTSHSRKVIAVHYDGNKNGYSEKDIYAGNGRIRHGNSMFKAWKPSDWVNNLGMNEYFKMSNDGSVTIYEPGLYLVYAQIHYNDDHDEIGFHLQVNNQPILQCMIDNSGHARNISQTCFSAQVTLLRKEDVLVFKEASSPRFAIFDKENSFFGLVKLGELGKHLN